MRIIAGKYKGRRIESARDGSIRPTSDFAREAIFNILAHGRNGASFIGKDVLDAFCGTGALGLEALSRGAGHATFIDQSRESLACARANAEKLHETSADFLQADAARLPPARRTYALAFLDPPYGQKLLAPALQSLASGGWLMPGALIVAEQDERDTLALPQAFTFLDERRYGRAVIKLLRFSA